MQLVVLGMHRSGTSTLTKLLAMLGAYVGEEFSSIGSNHENLGGFLERRDIRKINDQLLISNGYDWDKLSEFSIRQMSSLSIAKYQEEFRNIINELDLRKPWVIKEPRLGLYPSLIDEVLTTPFYLYIIRRPEEVFESLMKRNDFGGNLSEALWLFYNKSICSFLESRDNYLIIEYDTLVKEPERIVSMITETLRGQYGEGSRIMSKLELNSFLKPLENLLIDSSNLEISDFSRNVYEKIIVNKIENIDWNEEPSYFSEIIDYHHNAPDKRVREAKDVELSQMITRMYNSIESGYKDEIGIKSILNNILLHNKYKDYNEYTLRKFVLLEKKLNRNMNYVNSQMERIFELLESIKVAQTEHNASIDLVSPVQKFDNSRKTILPLYKNYFHRLIESFGVILVLIGMVFQRPARLRLLKVEKIKVLLKALRTENLNSIKKNAIKYLTNSSAYELAEESNIEYSSILDGLNNYKGFICVIPIYSVSEDIDKCIRNNIFHLSRSVHCKEIRVIDDSLSVLDERMESYLAINEKVKVTKNGENLGYTKSINRGMALYESTNEDFLLLNSDAILGPKSIVGIISVLSQKANIGTITPVSNNAGPFSLVEHNGLFNNLFSKEIPFLFNVVYHTKFDSIMHSSAPTGHGFCLYVTRAAFEKVGYMDGELFPLGYGEENDFCQRCIEHGLVNEIAWRSLVLHIGSLSFGNRKMKLLNESRKKIDAKFPNYKRDITQFFSSDNFRNRIEALSNRLKDVDNSYNVLFVLSSRTGGTPQTSLDLANGLGEDYNSYFLYCNSDELILERNNVPAAIYKLKVKINLKDHVSNEYNMIFGRILEEYNIDIVHVRHLSWHSLDIFRITKYYDLPLVYSCHDFYSLCPTVNLLDSEGNFCGGNCSNSRTSGDCPMPIWNTDTSVKRLKNEYVYEWRERLSSMMNYVDKFIFTSDHSLRLTQNTYEIVGERGKVIPHGRDFKKIYVPKHQDNEGVKNRLLFVGNIGPSKGSVIIRELYDRNKDKFDFHFLGRIHRDLLGCGIEHGFYDRENVIELIKDINPDFVCLFSIWPETFCHTLTESWVAGYPVITFGFGAIEERIDKYGGGCIIRMDSIQNIESDLFSVCGDEQAYGEMQKDILHWQNEIQSSGSIKNMAESYREVYKSILYGS